jgi:thiol-disulfide isomerase/thioredoxin
MCRNGDVVFIGSPPLAWKVSSGMDRSIPQRLRLLLLLLLALALSGCGANPGAAAPPEAATVSVDALPEGLGRGYPLAAPVDGDANTGLEVGEHAPNFRLTLDDGRALSLHDLAGRPVLINFWATWCGPCRIEMPELVRTAEATPELVILAVNVQEELEQIEAFAGDFQMTMPIPRDAQGEIRNLYQVRGMPTSYFIDREGIIRAVWAGALSPNRLEELLGQIL